MSRKTALWMWGMLVSFPLQWLLRKGLRDDFRLYRKDKATWDNRVAEQFAQDFVTRYKEILDRFD